jgi:hypothetical protein
VILRCSSVRYSDIVIDMSIPYMRCTSEILRGMRRQIGTSVVECAPIGRTKESRVEHSNSCALSLLSPEARGQRPLTSYSRWQDLNSPSTSNARFTPLCKFAKLPTSIIVLLLTIRSSNAIPVSDRYYRHPDSGWRIAN